MKKLFIILIVNLALNANAQCRLENPHPFAIEDVSAICNAIGMQYINVYESNIYMPCNQYRNNATSTNDMYGNPIIVYDPKWFEGIYLNLGRAANISILAHEIGHHAQNHSSIRGMFLNQWQKELEADFLSGYAMAKMGYSLYDSLIAIRNLSRGCSYSHPCTNNRIQAITNGWYYAN